MNQRDFKSVSPLALGLLLVLTSLLVGGCATGEPGNMSSRPWNTPKGWENGLPGGLMEERR